MATIQKTESGTWKAMIRKTGWPITIKTFRLKKDAEDWARRTEDEMVRGMFIQRAASERMTFEAAMKRYLSKVTPIKRPLTQNGERKRSVALVAFLAGEDRVKDGKPQPRAANTLRLELALLGHLFTIAVKEWGNGLTFNPLLNIRRPAPGLGRNRRLTPDEEKRLLAAVDQHSNPMLSWIVRIAVETGMRSSEIVTLCRSQVDIDRRIVRLVETKNSLPRTVPLSLAATEKFRLALNNPIRPNDTDLIFFGEPGKDRKRRPYNFNKIWLDIKRKAGVTDFKFHDLRHEAVSRLVESGLSDQEVVSISGHKSMQMLKRYTHLRAEDLVAKLDRLAR